MWCFQLSMDVPNGVTCGNWQSLGVLGTLTAKRLTSRLISESQGEGKEGKIQIRKNKNKISFLILFRIISKISVKMTGKFLIPIKYRNCYFFSVSWKSSLVAHVPSIWVTSARTHRTEGECSFLPPFSFHISEKYPSFLSFENMQPMIHFNYFFLSMDSGSKVLFKSSICQKLFLIWSWQSITMISCFGWFWGVLGVFTPFRGVLLQSRRWHMWPKKL